MKKSAPGLLNTNVHALCYYLFFFFFINIKIAKIVCNVILSSFYILDLKTGEIFFYIQITWTQSINFLLYEAYIM